MQAQDPKERLLEEEEQVRALAQRLMGLGDRAESERATLLTFLMGPMSDHMAFEEESIFPGLVRRGMASEVATALEHHLAIRQSTRDLEVSGPESNHQVVSAARMLLQHTNFEMDFMYPELTSEEWLTMLVG